MSFCSFLGSVHLCQSCCLSLDWVMLLWSVSMIWRRCVQLFSIRSCSLPVLTFSPQTLMNQILYLITKVSITTNPFSLVTVANMEPGKYVLSNEEICDISKQSDIISWELQIGFVVFYCGIKVQLQYSMFSCLWFETTRYYTLLCNLGF